MKRNLLFLVATLYFNLSQAQVVQWASEVIEFSSELTPVQYSSQQILGKPNVLPVGGENPSAWTPERTNSKEFIKVGYSNPISIRQIAIAESFNPSALFKVYVYDENQKEYLINSFSPKSIPLKGRMINIVVEETPYKVTAVKLEFDGASVPDYYSIDAIAISDSDIPIVANIDVPEFINPEILKERLSENVNSRYKEYNPILSPDGKTMYFSRKNHPENVGGVDDPEDIWYSELDSEGNWKMAKNMGTELNNEGPNFVSSATPDGKSVLLVVGNRYLDNDKMMAGVSVSSNESGSWSKPKPLIIENEYNYSSKSDFFLAQSRKTLLLSVMREDTEGGRDLYVSFSKDDDTWTEPLNLSNMVNTAGEETSPFLASDNKTLYFSSDGYSGFGKRDIYMTKRLDETWTNWSEPENLGPTINSQYEDLYFNIPGNSEYAYYSQGVTEGDVDIFRVALPLIKRPDPVIQVKGTLVSAGSDMPLRSKIEYKKANGSEVLGTTSSNATTGQYTLLLTAGDEYDIEIKSEGFVTETITVDLKDFDTENGDEYMLESIKLKPAVAAAVVEKQVTEPNLTPVMLPVERIQFDFDKVKPVKTSYTLLDEIIALMQKNNDIRLGIYGHADERGTEKYNLSLSKKRSEFVSNYIVKGGIEVSRLEKKYYGETKPLEKGKNAESYAKNRRVELQLLTGE